jgi:hypothetical protein
MSDPPIIITNGDSQSHRGASALSSPSHNSPAPSGPSQPPSEVNTPKPDIIESNDSDSASDIDAEGTEDDEYAGQALATNGRDIIVDAPTPSTSASSDDSRTRNASVDEEELMRLNPDLYGLRRSVCVSRSQPLDIETLAKIVIRDVLDPNARWYEAFRSAFRIQSNEIQVESDDSQSESDAVNPRKKRRTVPRTNGRSNGRASSSMFITLSKERKY